MSREVQRKCIDDAGKQSNHKYEQRDAYPQDHTWCLTAHSKQRNG